VIDESAVDKRISPAERMLSASGREHYFRVGQSALECIQKALDIASISPHRIKRILDLPCGHGRVLRYLKAAFPEAEITACDLLRDGVDYCSSMFGATALYSCDEPEDIPLEPGSLDLIWVGSLLTHLDAPLWPRFLAVFRNSLCPGGLLVFTTSGRYAYQRLIGSTDYGLSNGLSNRQTTFLAYRYERTGFSYTKYSQSESYYGHSLSHPAWVTRQLTAVGGLRLINLTETSWDQHQDVFASIREPACEGDVRQTPRVRYLRHMALDRINPRLRSVLESIWRRSFKRRRG
jgi:SAM-dependent methyltransferase